MESRRNNERANRETRCAQKGEAEEPPNSDEHQPDDFARA